MKTMMRIVTAAIVITGMFIIGCNSSADRESNSHDGVENAIDDASDATHEMGHDASTSVAQFRRDADVKINEYEASMADLRVKMANEKAENKAAYERKLSQLAQKTKEMKIRLKEYKETGKEEWSTFKTEFERDLDGVGTSISNFFTSDNSK
ncbi:MAG: hypothetical protein WC824_14930 [Bacteroidota bacterium]|jgi:hypothetical protein